MSAGYNIGSEGPLVHVAAILCTLLMRLPPFAYMDADITRKRSMLGAACAVGVVSTFGTPIGEKREKKKEELTARHVSR